MAIKFGSIKGISIEGTSFDVAADANASLMPTREKGDIVTSGKTSFTSTKKSPNIEGLTLIVDATAHALLKEYHESDQSLTLSYTDPENKVYRAAGTIDIAAKESEGGRIDVKMMPEDDWSLF